jgi:hypothetical protein
MFQFYADQEDEKECYRKRDPASTHWQDIVDRRDQVACQWEKPLHLCALLDRQHLMTVGHDAEGCIFD